MPRDDFRADVVRKLADRVGHRCANPKCRAATKGPNSAPLKATNVGKAAHIHAAAPGGPRYDPRQTPEQRRSIDNGIWLCSACAVLIDADAGRFPADRLRAWRTMAEYDARENIGKPAPGAPAQPQLPEVSLEVGYKRVQLLPKEHHYELVVVLKNEGTKRIDDWYLEVEFPRRFRLGAIYAGEVQRRSASRFRRAASDDCQTSRLRRGYQ